MTFLPLNYSHGPGPVYAAAARSVVQSTRGVVADAESESAISDVQEAGAHDRYRVASERAAEATER